MTDEIHISSAADNAFFPGLLVCLHSALVHLDRSFVPVLHVLDGGISDLNFERLQRVLTECNSQVKIIRHTVDLQDFSNFRIGIGHTSPMSYVRLLLPSLVRGERVIYLDSDILIGCDFAELWRAPFKRGCLLKVVQDKGIRSLRGDCPWACSEEDLQGPYFNSGVMVIDLDAWRDEQVAERTIELIHEDPTLCKLWDQTALNYILRGRAELLPECWNTPTIRVDSSDFVLSGVNYHYMTSFKPWLGKRPFAPYLFYKLWFERLAAKWGHEPEPLDYFSDKNVLSRAQMIHDWIKKYFYVVIRRHKGLKNCRKRSNRHQASLAQHAAFELEQPELEVQIRDYLVNIT